MLTIWSQWQSKLNTDSGSFKCGAYPEARGYNHMQTFFTCSAKPISASFKRTKSVKNGGVCWGDTMGDGGLICSTFSCLCCPLKAYIGHLDSCWFLLIRAQSSQAAQKDVDLRWLTIKSFPQALVGRKGLRKVNHPEVYNLLFWWWRNRKPMVGNAIDEVRTGIC